MRRRAEASPLAPANPRSSASVYVATGQTLGLGHGLRENALTTKVAGHCIIWLHFYVYSKLNLIYSSVNILIIILVEIGDV